MTSVTLVEKMTSVQRKEVFNYNEKVNVSLQRGQASSQSSVANRDRCLQSFYTGVGC